MSVTCVFSGRMGNCIYNIAQLVGHCRRHNLQYFIPDYAWACYATGGKMPLKVASTGPQPLNPVIYNEPTIEGHPFYHEIPALDNTEFRGYYQSFKYFDFCRQEVLDVIGLPWKLEKGIVSLHVRRGDCVAQTEAFPLAPMEYYHKAVETIQEKGYNNFRVYSDDIPWCKEEFTTDRYPGALFEFSEGKGEIEDFVSMSGCEHNITARSTFSLLAAWFNQNPDKIVMVPDSTFWWKGQNRDLVPDYFTQIKW